MRNFNSLFAAFVAAFIVLFSCAAPVMAQEKSPMEEFFEEFGNIAPVSSQDLTESTLVPEPSALIGPQICGVEPNSPAPINTDCYVVVPDENDMPVEKLAASTDSFGDYWISPLIVGDMFNKGMLKAYGSAPIIAAYADENQTAVWPSSIRLNENDAGTHVEITPQLAAELCAIFGKRPYQEEGFVPMALLQDQDGFSYGPVCNIVGFPTQEHLRSFAEAGYPLSESDQAVFIGVGLLADGRWFVDYALLQHNGLTDMLVPFYDIELPLSTLLSCQEEDSRLGCQNTEASSRGGESGYPYISLVGS
jgi:hypothetical protein